MANRPKNHLITDATSPYTFRFNKFGKNVEVTCAQSPEEETWPGGALWDVGLLMARLLVLVDSRDPRISPEVWGPKSWKERRILELGAGVGLTGLTAAAIGARAVLLTDLDVVVQKITIPNVERNKHLGGNGGSNISACTLCWGDSDDETNAAARLDELAPPLLHDHNNKGTSRKKKKKKALTNQSTNSSPKSRRLGIPDILLIGDVAYQHRPGAMSHFDALMSTVLRFTDEHTIVMFGTRMRMPASRDLLEMFRNEFDEVVVPIEAHEIDNSFNKRSLGRQHNISMHIMKRKRPQHTF